MSLRVRDTEVRELMDDPDCDARRLAATFRRFGIVNRLVSGGSRRSPAATDSTWSGPAPIPTLARTPRHPPVARRA